MKNFLSSILLIIIVSTSVFSQNQAREYILENIDENAETSNISVDGIVLYSQDILPLFYKNRDYKPAWGNMDNVIQLMNSINNSYYEGLIPEDYHLERINNLLKKNKRNPKEKDIADIDLLLTDAIILYVSHLRQGKVDQSLLREGWDMSPNTIPENAQDLLEKSLDNNDITGPLQRALPDNFMYVHLKQGLADYRFIEKNGGWPEIPEGETLKLGMKDPRVVLIKKYLSITGDMKEHANNLNDSVYDSSVEIAIKNFQYRHNLNQDGVLGKGTLAMMNIPIEKRIQEIRINMDRSRWVIHHFPADFLVVNIAGYNVRRITNGKVVYYSRVIVGKHYHATPIFMGKLRYIEINPTWTLPYSIATKETLPKLKKDPEYLAKKNMIIMDRSGVELDPATIDFNSLSRGNFPYTLRQKAGPNNALGEVKFMFPNKYAVYLHDTPGRSLFATEERAYSHGCIRLEDKWTLLFSLMNDPDVWNMDKVNEVLASGKTTRVNLETPIDILLLYWTAGADVENQMFFNKDIYDRDPEVLELLDKPVLFKKVN